MASAPYLPIVPYSATFEIGMFHPLSGRSGVGDDDAEKVDGVLRH